MHETEPTKSGYTVRASSMYYLRRFGRHAIWFVLAVYFCLAIAAAGSKLPFCDEGWLASPGLNLIRHGTMETSVIEPAGSWLKGIDRYTYWVMPLWLLGLAVWFKIFGFSLLVMRSFSAVWGVIGLGMTMLIGRKLFPEKGIGLGACAILAFESQWLFGGSTARMDMMAAVLDLSAFALYLQLRETRFRLAILISHTCVCAAALTHPNGAIAFPALVVMTLRLDRERIRVRDLAILALPYFVGLSLWGFYISHDPSIFVAQLRGNAKPDRGMLFYAPGQAAKLEITQRYLDGFGFARSGIKRLRFLVLAAYLISAAGLAGISSLRRQEGVRLLLALMTAMAVGLFIIDGIKRTLYLVYVVPYFALALAVFTGYLMRRFQRVAWLPPLCVGGLCLMQFAGAIVMIRDNQYQSAFLPVTNYLSQYREEGHIVMGPSELGFRLGFDKGLVDDYRLGYYSGLKAEYIVVDSNYQAFFASLSRQEPAVSTYVREILSARYDPVFENRVYTIYRRRQ